MTSTEEKKTLEIHELHRAPSPSRIQLQFSAFPTLPICIDVGQAIALRRYNKTIFAIRIIAQNCTKVGFEFERIIASCTRTIEIFRF